MNRLARLAIYSQLAGIILTAPLMAPRAAVAAKPNLVYLLAADLVWGGSWREWRQHPDAPN